MYRKNLLISLVISLLLLPAHLRADTWGDFYGYMDRYYFIDDQDFSEISCSVSVGTLNKVVEDLREKVSTIPGAVIQENLSDFRLILKKGSTVSFLKPDLEVYLPSDGRLTDKERKQKGAKMIEDGFDMSVEGSVMVLEGLFESYIRPSRPEFSLESFSIDPEMAEFTYTLKGQPFRSRCSANKCVRRYAGEEMTIESIDTYELSDSKYFLTSSRSFFTDSTNTITSTINIDYMTLGKIKLPSSIAGSLEMRSSDTEIEGTIDITLKDCRIK